jgi:hypothetical protein
VFHSLREFVATLEVGESVSAERLVAMTRRPATLSARHARARRSRILRKRWHQRPIGERVVRVLTHDTKKLLRELDLPAFRAR